MQQLVETTMKQQCDWKEAEALANMPVEGK